MQCYHDICSSEEEMKFYTWQRCASITALGTLSVLFFNRLRTMPLIPLGFGAHDKHAYNRVLLPHHAWNTDINVACVTRKIVQNITTEGLIFKALLYCGVQVIRCSVSVFICVPYIESNSLIYTKHSKLPFTYPFPYRTFLEENGHYKALTRRRVFSWEEQ